MVIKYNQMQWLYLNGPAQLLLHEHVLEVDGEDVEGVVVLQHDDTAWLGHQAEESFCLHSWFSGKLGLPFRRCTTLIG